MSHVFHLNDDFAVLVGKETDASPGIQQGFSKRANRTGWSKSDADGGWLGVEEVKWLRALSESK